MANDTRHLPKLKKKINATFPDQLYFVTAKANTPEIVPNANKVSAYVAPNKESNILTAANIIKKDILQNWSDKTKTKPAWPSTTEQFSASEKNIPESVHLFLKELLKSEKHIVSRSENIAKVVESYAADLVHELSRGEIMTSNHFLLGLGIHNITGSFDQMI